jgi:putative FmdB family regulatory protein
MPLYEYECSKCKNKIELLEKYSENTTKICSICGGLMKRIMSKNTFHLKGNGWYITDYKNKEQK